MGGGHLPAALAAPPPRRSQAPRLTPGQPQRVCPIGPAAARTVPLSSRAQASVRPPVDAPPGSSRSPPPAGALPRLSRAGRRVMPALACPGWPPSRPPSDGASGHSGGPCPVGATTAACVRPAHARYPPPVAPLHPSPTPPALLAALPAAGVTRHRTPSPGSLAWAWGDSRPEGGNAPGPPGAACPRGA